MQEQDFDLIETPENVELEQRLAGIGSRLVAGVIDVIIMFLVFFIGFLLLLLASGINSVGAAFNMQAWAVAFMVVVLFLMFWGYPILFEYWWNGQTPGKRHMRIRVVREGGGGVGFAEVATRNLLRIVDLMPFGYGVAGVTMFLTRKVQRLGDLAAGTVVISEQATDYSAFSDRTTPKEWEAAMSPAALRATSLTPQEYRVIANYHIRRTELSLEARERVLPKLLAPILVRLGVQLPEMSVVVMEAYVDELMDKARRAEQSEKPPEAQP